LLPVGRQALLPLEPHRQPETLIKNTKPAGAWHQWLTPRIPATQETDQEGPGSEPAWANSSRAGGVAQSVDPEFKPQYLKKQQQNISEAAQATENPTGLHCVVWTSLELAILLP
jgi:hypothetical protein